MYKNNKYAKRKVNLKIRASLYTNLFAFEQIRLDADITNNNSKQLTFNESIANKIFSTYDCLDFDRFSDTVDSQTRYDLRVR